MNKLIKKSLYMMGIISAVSIFINQNPCSNVFAQVHTNKTIIIDNSKFECLSEDVIVTEWDFTDVISSISYFEEIYPNKSENEIAQMVYEDLYSSKRYVGGLNSAEFNIIFNSLGLRGFFKVRDIANEVTDTTIEKYGISGYQDDSDAFRHTYLSAVLYDRISKKFSIDLMTAHEKETTDSLDKKMDLHNNSRGICLYDRWIKMGKYGSLQDFIAHCIFNGHFYNTKKIVTINNSKSLIFTEKGIDNDQYANKSTTILNTSLNFSSNMIENDFQWYKFNSNKKSGTFNITSYGDVDLQVELYSSRDKNASLISKNDDSGDNYNFSLNFELSYYESVYIKVKGFNDAKSGNYQIRITEVNVKEAPSVEYIKCDKKSHYKVDQNGKKIKESHVILSNSQRYTNCILCGQNLDTSVDGPFFMKTSLLSLKSVSLVSVIDNDILDLNKDQWEEYIESFNIEVE